MLTAGDNDDTVNGNMLVGSGGMQDTGGYSMATS